MGSTSGRKVEGFITQRAGSNPASPTNFSYETIAGCRPVKRGGPVNLKNTTNNMKLNNPLAFIDMRAVGPKGAPGNLVKHSRLAALGVIRVNVDGSKEARHFQFEGRANWREGVGFISTPFADQSEEIRDLLYGCDFAGFSLRRFDMPLLAEEFARAGHVAFPSETARIINVQSIFHLKEQRDMAAAVRFYLNQDFNSRHPSGDALYCLQILERQMARYPDLPENVTDLARFCSAGKNLADFAGLLFWDAEGRLCWNFGKYNHQPVLNNPQYLEYFLKDSFPFQSQYIAAEYAGIESFLSRTMSTIQ